MKSVTWTVCLAVTLLCLPLAAQETTRPAGGGLAERFGQLDRNGDGKVSAEEYPGPVFRQVDRDGDGFVTLEEARAYYLDRRAARRATTQPASEASPLSEGELQVVDAVFELCVRDVEACAKFYRDGIGMREVEPADAQKGALLEWAGCYLRLRKVAGDKPAPATGNPMRQMLASNGFRWFSLWFDDPAAVSERLVKAGYPAPVKGANVSMTRDPDGNIVEIMGVPRSASGETFTWGMGVSDDVAAREFYGKTLGLAEFDPWNLPPPFSMKMYLFATGAGRIKFSSPEGQRPGDAAAGPDAPGLRSVTLRVVDVAAAREGLVQRGAKVEGEKRLLVTDPDGNRIYIAQAPADAIKAARTRPTALSRVERKEAAADGREGQSSQRRQSALERLRDRYGDVQPTPHTEEVAEQRPGEPPLKKMPDSDATRDAAGRGQLFESVVVPGFTSIQQGMNGFAIADLNKDGLVDILATYSAPRGTGGGWGSGEKLRVFINEGNFRFRPHTITILDSQVTPEAFGRGQVPNLADFNGDGFLDLFVTRHAQMSGGESNPRDQKLGNGLYITDGAWDVFRDVSEKMGIQNERAYNRQPSIGDVNRDGWLDIAIGCDNIGNAMGGVPHSRLYVFEPVGTRFEAGHFADIGGTDLVPDFGGFYHDSAKDRSGPDINLRDLDNDDDLDLLQSYHVDVREPLLPYSPGEYRQGVFCWKNLLVETGTLRFEKVTNNGLHCEARLRYHREKQIYEPASEARAPGLPYVSLADVDRDGLLDVLAVGPNSDFWAPRVEDVSGRFWKNLGGFRFEDRTAASGIDAINRTYREWAEFFDAPIPWRYRNWRPRVTLEKQPGRSPSHPLDRRPYYADAIFGDFDNDGRLDLVVLDRSEGVSARAILFMGTGQGSFEVKPSTFSGLDGSGISGEGADLNNDGLLDLVFAADPDNSGGAPSMDRYESKVYWNTGLHGARDHHWLRLRFSGLKDAELIGARVEAREPESNKLLGMRVIAANHSYKSGGALEAHFGLGGVKRVDLTITMLSGRKITIDGVGADQFQDLNLATRVVSEVQPG